MPWISGKPNLCRILGGSSKSFPKHETRDISDHMNVARCAKFSPDGIYFATGSGDTLIKFFEVAKIKQMMLGDSKEGLVWPVIRTFYDHMQVIMSSSHTVVFLLLRTLRLFSSTFVRLLPVKALAIRIFIFAHPTACS